MPDVGGLPDTPRRPLRSRNFGLFFTARAATRLGTAMLPVALSAGLLQQGMGATEVGYALASHFVCVAGFIVFGGVFADRLDARRLMVCADVACVVTQSVMAAMFLGGRVGLWQLCAVSAVSGIATGLFEPGVARTVPAVADDVQAANGAVRTAESLATLAGPALAGVLIAVASPGAVFAVHAGTYLVSAVCLVLLRLPVRTGPPRAGTSTYWADLAEGWREFRARTWMWGTIVVWMVLMITVAGPLVPLTSVEIISAHDAQAYGLVSSALGGGTALGALLAMRIRPVHPLRAGSLALFGFACYPPAVGAGLPFAAVAAAAAISGAGAGFWSVMWATSVQTQVPGAVLGRIKAYEAAGSIVMMPVGQALAGPAATLLGTRTVLLTSGAMGVAVCVALLSVPAIRGLRRVTGFGTPAGQRS
ncbi:MFS transporter [Streptomyces pathocidini]|uniref:MFS transporter n=1 Tax=Streptomyces pathocidini TaxID=1650571 RepID=UPI003F4CFF0E